MVILTIAMMTTSSSHGVIMLRSFVTHWVTKWYSCTYESSRGDYIHV